MFGKVKVKLSKDHRWEEHSTPKSGQKYLGRPPFWTHLDHFGTLTSLPCLASFGPKWTIFGPSPVIHGGHQSKKKAHHQVSYVWPACRTPKFHVWILYESFSDVGEIWVWFASKILTPCRMHWNAFLIAQIIAKCHSFPNMYGML